jgi:hypothetical protein
VECSILFSTLFKTENNGSGQRRAKVIDITLSAIFTQCYGRRVRKSWRLVAALVCLTVCTTLILRISSRVPSTRGKSLEEWSSVYMNDSEGPAQSTNTANCRQAVAAVRSIRNVATSYALKQLQIVSPQWKNRAQSLFEKFNVRQYCPRALWLPFYEYPGESAVVYFQMLGEDANAALPELLKNAENENNPRIARRAIDAMSYIGTEAIPFLLEIVAARRGYVCCEAVRAIGVAGRRQPEAANVAVPTLIECLHHHDPDFVSSAIAVFGSLHLDPARAVPALAEVLNRGNAYQRAQAAEAIMRYSLDGRPAVNALIDSLKDADSEVRVAATNALRQVAPNAFQASVCHSYR